MMANIILDIEHVIESLGWPTEAVLRLLLAGLAGGLVGLEREIRGRQAGFRTNLLVGMGSALVMLVSIHFAEHQWPHSPGINLNIDPARIAYGVMTGIGFLGAGAIIHQRASVRGLTTAAGLWCVAAIGLASGLGLYFLACIASVLVVLSLWLLSYVENWLPKEHYKLMTIRRKWHQGCIAETIGRFKSAGFKLSDVSFQRSNDLLQVDVAMRVAFANKKSFYHFEQQLENDPELQLMAIQDQ